MAAPTRVRMRSGSTLYVPLPIETVTERVDRARRTGAATLRLADRLVHIERVRAIDEPASTTEQVTSP